MESDGTSTRIASGTPVTVETSRHSFTNGDEDH